MAIMYSSRDEEYWDYVHKMEVWWYDGLTDRYVFNCYCCGDVEAAEWEHDGFDVVELGEVLP